MRQIYLLSSVFLAFVLFSCRKDDDSTKTQEFVVAFEAPSLGITSEDTSKEVKLVFSRAATENGTATISYTNVNAEYGTHFTTTPPAENKTIKVPITAGSKEVTFKLNKLQNATEGKEMSEMSINFKITSISNPGSVIQGNTSLEVSFSEITTTALGGVIAPETGGADQPNQVYIDLSSQKQKTVKRDAWDLGFYNGKDFRVVINSSLLMAAVPLEATNIDAVTEADVTELKSKVAVGTFNPENVKYIDDPSGSIQKTVIGEVSEKEAENKVYLVNLGIEIGGSIHKPGGARGWKKIRVLRRGTGYLLQYADLNATTHKRIVLGKAEGYNFTFINFASQKGVSVEPMKDKWDLNYTVFTNILPHSGSYAYSDFVVSNSKAGVTAYKVSTSDFTYEDFKAENVVEANLSADQRSIGGNWRDVQANPNKLYNNVFFVLKDTDGNYYKIRFTALVNESGERGYPKFEYKLL